MPRRQEDIQSTNQAGNALMQLILGARQKQAQAAQEQDYKNQELDKMFGQAQSLKKQYGPQVSVGAGPFHIQGEPSGGLAGDRAIDNLRLETKALQEEGRKLSGVKPEAVMALQDVKNQLASNKQMNIGQMKSQLARLAGEKGVLTEGDIQRILPNTLMRSIKGIGAFISPKTFGEDMLSDYERENISKMLADKELELSNMQERANQELSGRASMLAPSLAKSGNLPQVMKSLGQATSRQPASVQDPEMDEYLKLKAKYGR